MSQMFKLVVRRGRSVQRKSEVLLMRHVVLVVRHACRTHLLLSGKCGVPVTLDWKRRRYTAVLVLGLGLLHLHIVLLLCVLLTLVPVVRPVLRVRRLVRVVHLTVVQVSVVPRVGVTRIRLHRSAGRVCVVVTLRHHHGIRNEIMEERRSTAQKNTCV